MTFLLIVIINIKWVYFTIHLCVSVQPFKSISSITIYAMCMYDGNSLSVTTTSTAAAAVTSEATVSFIFHNIVDDDALWMFVVICTVHRKRHIPKTSTTFDLYTQFPCLSECARVSWAQAHRENGINRRT